MPLLHARALCSAKLGERARALADAVAVARARPGWVDALVSVGRAYAALGDWEKATPPWESALAEQPGNTLLRRDLERAKMEAAHGGGARSGGAPSEGAGEAEGAGDDDEGAAEGAAEGSSKAMALKELANAATSRFELGRALEYLGEAIGLEPRLAALWANRSHVHELLRDSEAALSDAHECMALAPSWAKGYYRAARALLSLGRYADAVAALATARELEPDDAKLRELHDEATLLERRRRRDEAALASEGGGGDGRGDVDMIGVARGGCKKSGCPAYVQRHGSLKTWVQGVGYVRHENDVSFLHCLRCGCPAYLHANLEAAPPSAARRAADVEARRRQRDGHGLGAAELFAHDFTPSGAKGGLIRGTTTRIMRGGINDN